MEGCLHPPQAQYYDRGRGTMTCALCGEVVNDHLLELDPSFSRGDKPSAPGNRQAGFARSLRSTVLSSPATHRPSIDNARRSMSAIARQLDISVDHVEMAVAIFKLAVNVNAISGSKPPVLCACLYAICRREYSPHMLLDFADAIGENPTKILAHLKNICRATNTKLPPPDPSFYIERISKEIGVPDELCFPVAVLGIKIIRAMDREWITYGRRPLGLCAAATMVAANAYGVNVSLEKVVNISRLALQTIMKRVREFSDSAAGSVEDIDSYYEKDTEEVNSTPQAYKNGLNYAESYKDETQERRFSEMYYALAHDAARSAPATEERKQCWKEFITYHCKKNNIPISESNLELENISSSEQLRILGHSGIIPMKSDEVKEEVETQKESLFRTLAAFSSSQAASKASRGGVGQFPVKSTNDYDNFSNCSNNDIIMDDFFVSPGCGDPRNDEDEFAFEGGISGEKGSGQNIGNFLVNGSTLADFDNMLTSVGKGVDKANISTQADAVQRVLDSCYVLQKLNVYNEDSICSEKKTSGIPQSLIDEARSAIDHVEDCMDFEVIVLPPFTQDTWDALDYVGLDMCPPKEVKEEKEPNINDDSNKTVRRRARDIDPYIIESIELRRRKEEVLKRSLKDKWDLGIAKSDEEIRLLELRACVVDKGTQVLGKANTNRRRNIITESDSAAEALRMSLRGKGARQIDVNAVFGEEDDGADEDDFGGGWDKE